MARMDALERGKRREIRRDFLLDEQAIREAAITEALHPDEDHMRAFLAINPLVFEGQTPRIEDIIVTEEHVAVYFPIQGEPYYVVVYLHVEPSVSVVGMAMMAGNAVSLRIVSEHHTLDELLSQIDLTTTSIWEEEGERKQNGFTLQPYPKTTGEVGDKLRALLDMLRPHRAALEALTSIAQIEIQIVYQDYQGQMSGFYFEPELFQMLEALHIPLKFAISAHGPAVEEDPWDASRQGRKPALSTKRHDQTYEERSMSLGEPVIRDAAIAEVLHPTLESTRSSLSRNTLVFEGEMPRIEDLLLTEEGAEVYFPVQGERYYLVISVRRYPQIVVSRVGISGANKVYLGVRSEDHSLDELLSRCDLTPTRTWEKQGKRIRHNGFAIDSSPKTTGTVDDKLRRLVQLILPHKASLQNVATIGWLDIQIVYWGAGDERWTMRFEPEVLQVLGELGLSVDVDLYASGPDGESSVPIVKL